MTRKKILSALAAGMILMISGCSQSGETTLQTNETEAESSSVETAENTMENEQSAAETVATTINITMTAGDQVITAALEDSVTTRAFLKTLPRTLTMSEYGGREYFGRMEAIAEDGEAIADFEDGDVTYYPAGPSFAVFYAGADTSDQSGLIRMGKITSDLSVFENLGDSVELEIAISE